MAKRKKTKPTVDERIEHELSKWGRALGLQAWIINYQLVDLTDLAHTYKSQPAAELTPMYPYLRVRIDFNKEYVTHADEEELSRVILHEFVHIMLLPIRKVVDEVAGPEGELTRLHLEAEEAVTDHIAAVLWDLRDWKGLTGG